MNEYESNNDETDNKGRNLIVWEDVVNIRDLVFSILICLIATTIGYILGGDDSSRALLFGIVGAVLGFILCSIIFKPKRKMEFVDEEQ